MSCPYCHKEVKHRKPCKVLVEMQEKERVEEEQRKMEDENQRLEMINTTNDADILKGEILKLREENEKLKVENDSLKQQINDLENPYEDPYQYRCFRCGSNIGYDGHCDTCERIRSSDY